MADELKDIPGKVRKELIVRLLQEQVLEIEGCPDGLITK